MFGNLFTDNISLPSKIQDEDEKSQQPDNNYSDVTNYANQDTINISKSPKQQQKSQQPDNNYSDVTNYANQDTINISKSPKQQQKSQQSDNNYSNNTNIKGHLKKEAINISKKLISDIAGKISLSIPKKQPQNNQKLIQELIQEITRVLEPNLNEPIPNLEELIKEAVINATT
jgi:hypothetical protein